MAPPRKEPNVNEIIKLLFKARGDSGDRPGVAGLHFNQLPGWGCQLARAQPPLPPCWGSRANRGHVRRGAGSSTATRILLHFRSTSVYLLLVCQGLTSSDDDKQGSVVRINPSKEMQNVHAPAVLSGLAPKSDNWALVAFLFPLLLGVAR